MKPGNQNRLQRMEVDNAEGEQIKSVRLILLSSIKLNVLLLLFILGQGHIQAQDNIIKYRAVKVSFRVDEGEWTEPTHCGFLVVFRKQRILIYADITQQLDVIKSSKSDDFHHLDFTCIDNYGKEVYLRYTPAKPETGDPALLMVIYSERIQVMYELQKI